MAGAVKSTRDDIAFIAEAKKRFKLAEEYDRDNRNRALADAEFEADTGDGDTESVNGVWPDKVKRAREADGRICLTINKSRTITRQVSNELRLKPLAINIAPTEDGDVETAAVIEGLVRSIEQRSKAKRIYAKAAEDAARGNMGFWRVTTDYVSPDSFDQEILIKPILNPMSVLFDPAAEDSTCRDARWGFVFDDMPKDEFETRFKDKARADFYAEGSSYCDGVWVQENTIRLAEYWCVEPKVATLQLLSDGTTRWKDDKTAPLPIGVTVKQERQSVRKSVCMYLISGAEVLEETPWAGDRIPIVPVWGEEARIGNRRKRNGVLTYARDAIRLHSFARSANAETVASQPKAPWLVTPKMTEGYGQMWQNAANGNPAVLYYNFDAQGAGKPERMPPPTPSSGWVQEALQSADDIKTTTGIFDASLGQRSNETSGKAIMARQREGDVGTYAFVDNVTDAAEETGRIIVDLIPHIYDAPREIRILGKRMEPQVLKVNQALYKPKLDQSGHPMMDPQTGQPIGDVQHIDLTVGRYDVTVSTGPSVTTQRQETAEMLTNALQAAPMLAPVILPRLAEVIDLPDADDFAKEVKALLQPNQPPDLEKMSPQELQAYQQQQQQAQQQAQMQHEMQMQGAQLSLAEIQAKVHKLNADAAHSMAKAQNEGSPEGDPQAAQIDMAMKAANLREAEANADAAQANAGIAYANLAAMTNPVAAEAQAMQTVAEAHQAAASAQQAHIQTAMDLHDLAAKPLDAAHQAVDLQTKLNPPDPAEGQGAD